MKGGTLFLLLIYLKIYLIQSTLLVFSFDILYLSIYNCQRKYFNNNNILMIVVKKKLQSIQTLGHSLTLSHKIIIYHKCCPNHIYNSKTLSADLFFHLSISKGWLYQNLRLANLARVRLYPCQHRPIFHVPSFH